MSFWDLFKKEVNNIQFSSRLHQKISHILESKDDDQIAKIACIAGLLARVAYADMKIKEDEVEQIKIALNDWSHLNQTQIKVISQIACDEVKDLAGIQNYKYASPLNDLLSEDERYKLLVTLFAMAASDGNADHLESEEIRIIATALLLSHNHFISARATVLQHLGALK